MYSLRSVFRRLSALFRFLALPLFSFPAPLFFSLLALPRFSLPVLLLFGFPALLLFGLPALLFFGRLALHSFPQQVGFPRHTAFQQAQRLSPIPWALFWVCVQHARQQFIQPLRYIRAKAFQPGAGFNILKHAPGQRLEDHHPQRIHI